jgi:hypothetical protein
MPVISHAEIAAMQAKRRALLPAGSSAPKTAQELRLFVDRIIFARVEPLPRKGIGCARSLRSEAVDS